jgi:predicted MFS family arabinose efflux permease
MSAGGGTGLVFLAYLCWSSAVFAFLGLYPTWIVQHGLPGHGPGGIGAMLFLGEVGGLFGAMLSGRLASRFAHPLALCAVAAFATAAIVLFMPFAHGMAVVQGIAYMGFAFGRDLMLALILGGAMLLIPASQRGSLNAVLNAIYQTGATMGGLASAFLYGLRADFTANAGVSAALFVVCGVSLWRVVRSARAVL